MYFTVKFYKYYEKGATPVYETTEPSLYDAMVCARLGTGDTDCGLAEVLDSHGQFIVHFEDGELRHGYE